MPIYQRDVEFAKKTLWPEETVIATATQRRIGPGMSFFNPMTIVITDKRVIIINRNMMGLRRDVETIPYDMIGSVRLERGFISSSVFLRVGGYTSPGEQGFLKKGEQEGEIDGLRKVDAKAISDCLDRAITEGRPGLQLNEGQYGGSSNPSAAGVAGGGGGGQPIYCPKCRRKNEWNAQFCEGCGSRLKT